MKKHLLGAAVTLALGAMAALWLSELGARRVERILGNQRA